jgi:hypothetical protein
VRASIDARKQFPEADLGEDSSRGDSHGGSRASVVDRRIGDKQDVV